MIIKVTLVVTVIEIHHVLVFDYTSIVSTKTDLLES